MSRCIEWEGLGVLLARGLSWYDCNLDASKHVCGVCAVGRPHHHHRTPGTANHLLCAAPSPHPYPPPAVKHASIEEQQRAATALEQRRAELAQYTAAVEREQQERLLLEQRIKAMESKVLVLL